MPPLKRQRDDSLPWDASKAEARIVRRVEVGQLCIGPVEPSAQLVLGPVAACDQSNTTGLQQITNAQGVEGARRRTAATTPSLSARETDGVKRALVEHAVKRAGAVERQHDVVLHEADGGRVSRPSVFCCAAPSSSVGNGAPQLHGAFAVVQAEHGALPAGVAQPEQQVSVPAAHVGKGGARAVEQAALGQPLQLADRALFGAAVCEPDSALVGWVGSVVCDFAAVAFVPAAPAQLLEGACSRRTGRCTTD